MHATEIAVRPPIPMRPRQINDVFVPAAYKRLKNPDLETGEVIAALIELAERIEKSPHDETENDWLFEGLSVVMSHSDSHIIVAKILLHLDTTFTLKSAMRLMKDARHKCHQREFPSPIKEDEFDTYCRSRNNSEASAKLVAVLEGLHHG